MIPAHPSTYTVTAHATKFRYKEMLGLHIEYKEHMCNSVKAFSTCFTEGLLIDLEADEQVIGYTVMEICTHTKDNFLLPWDISWEITKTKVDLKVAYNSNEIVHVYQKKMYVSKLTLTALGDPITDVEIMGFAFETF